MTIARGPSPLTLVRPVADALLVSGGDVYDARVIEGLRALGRTVDDAQIPGTWPRPDDAARRELREELGIEAELGAAWRVLTDGPDELSVWLVRAWTGEVRNVADHEHERLGWFTAGELSALDLAHPAYVGLLTEALGT